VGASSQDRPALVTQVWLEATWQEEAEEVMVETNHWWTISGDDLMGALHQVADGADPDTVYQELYDDSQVESVPAKGKRKKK
jgi:hypothetical protein